MADGYVQVPVDSTGKKIDTTEFVDYSGVTKERQRMDIPNPVIVSGDILNAILIELRLNNTLIAQGLNIRDDLDLLRADLQLNTNIL